jgi:hypothetical protein
MSKAFYASHGKDTWDAATTNVRRPMPTKKGGKAAPTAYRRRRIVVMKVASAATNRAIALSTNARSMIVLLLFVRPNGVT